MAHTQQTKDAARLRTAQAQVMAMDVYRVTIEMAARLGYPPGNREIIAELTRQGIPRSYSDTPERKRALKAFAKALGRQPTIGEMAANPALDVEFIPHTDGSVSEALQRVGFDRQGVMLWRHLIDKEVNDTGDDEALMKAQARREWLHFHTKRALRGEMFFAVAPKVRAAERFMPSLVPTRDWRDPALDEKDPLYHAFVANGGADRLSTVAITDAKVGDWRSDGLANEKLRPKEAAPESAPD